MYQASTKAGKYMCIRPQLIFSTGLVSRDFYLPSQNFLRPSKKKANKSPLPLPLTERQNIYMSSS